MLTKPIQDSSEPVNVWWYGTRGEDSAVDQAAIQQALDVAALTGRACYIPRGIYRITDTLLIGANVHVFGDGIGATILRGKAGAYAGKTVNGTTLLSTLGAVAKSNVTVTDLTIDHATNGTTANGISFLPDANFTGTPCSYVTVERCQVLGFVAHEYLIWGFRLQNAKVVNNWLNGNTAGAYANDQVGIAISGSSSVLVSGNTVVGCDNWGIGVYSVLGFANVSNSNVIVTDNYVATCATGIRLDTTLDGGFGAQNMNDVICANNNVRANTVVGIILITPIAGTTMLDVRIAGNDVVGGPVGITVQGFAADVGHRNIAVCNNNVYNQTTVALGAITVSTFNAVSVNDNKIANSAWEGVRVTGSSDVEVSRNFIHRCQHEAIHGDTVTRMVANDNRSVDNQLSNSTYGILIANAVMCVAKGNICSTASAFASITMTGTSGIVADNRQLAGPATPWINLCVSANASFAAPAAPGAAAATLDIVNALATNVVNLGAQINVQQVAGAPNGVTVTRIATGFRFTFAAAAVGNEQYQWEIRQ